MCTIKQGEEEDKYIYMYIFDIFMYIRRHIYIRRLYIYIFNVGDELQTIGEKDAG